MSRVGMITVWAGDSSPISRSKSWLGRLLTHGRRVLVHDRHGRLDELGELEVVVADERE